MNKTTRIIKIIAILLVSIFLCVWLAAIARCEYLTFCHSEQFKDLYREYTMFSRPDYLKLLEYSEERAVVYYVKRGSGGDVVVFEKGEKHSVWGFVSWKTIWSRSGSADGFVWPYIR